MKELKSKIELDVTVESDDGEVRVYLEKMQLIRGYINTHGELMADSSNDYIDEALEDTSGEINSLGEKLFKKAEDMIKHP